MPTLLVTRGGERRDGVVEGLPGAGRDTTAGRWATPISRRRPEIPVDLTGWKVDVASISGRKIYGPEGKRRALRPPPTAGAAGAAFSGGGQQRGLRSGTLPAPLIVGLGEACPPCAGRNGGRGAAARGLRDQLLARLPRRSRPRGAWQHGERGFPEAWTDFPGVDRRRSGGARPGALLSTGSACRSAAIEPSYVLRALGLERRAASRTVRIGLGRVTAPAEVDFAAAAVPAPQPGRRPRHRTLTRP